MAKNKKNKKTSKMQNMSLQMTSWEKIQNPDMKR